MSNLKKARALYVSRNQEYEKAKDSAQKAEVDSMSQSSGMAKIEKKKKLEEEAMHKVIACFVTFLLNILYIFICLKT